MDRYILRRPVTIRGFDFFGRAAEVRLEPTEKKGWYWRVEGGDVPITGRMLMRKHRRVALWYGAHELNVFEHLGALRFTGLDNIRIISATPWLPYDGSAEIFWRACEPAKKRSGTLSRHTTPKMISTGPLPTDRSYVVYEPGPADALEVGILIDYSGLGGLERTYTIPGVNMEEILCTKTQGWPPRSKWLGRLWSSRLVLPRYRWPHFHAVVWPQDQSPEETLALFSRHRLLDLLGTFSTLCPPGGILVGRVDSYCAGHAEDINLTRGAEVQSVGQIQTPSRTAAE